MEARVVRITSSVAEHYLKSNTQNRSVNPTNLANLIRAMENDSFKENGATIRFDKNGVLLDGQHRLMAIQLSGKVYNIVVVTGLEPEVFSSIDTMQKLRSANDVLSLAGIGNGNKLNSAIKVTMELIRREPANSATFEGSHTYDDTLSFISNYLWVPDYYKTICGLSKSITCMKKQGTTGAAIYCALKTSQSKAIGFWSLVLSGENISKGMAAYASNRFILQRNGKLTIDEASGLVAAYYDHITGGKRSVVKAVDYTPPLPARKNWI